jgi:hypothetical protein
MLYRTDLTRNQTCIFKNITYVVYLGIFTYSIIKQFLTKAFVGKISVTCSKSAFEYLSVLDFTLVIHFLILIEENGCRTHGYLDNANIQYTKSLIVN